MALLERTQSTLPVLEPKTTVIFLTQLFIDFIHIKMLRIIRSAKPLKRSLVFLMFGVGYDFNVIFTYKSQADFY